MSLGRLKQVIIRKPASSGDSCIPSLIEGSDDFTLYTEGDDLYADMLASIASAEYSVDMESYIFAADEVGWRFAEALVAKRREGVRVRLNIDAAGSLYWGSRGLVRFMRDHDVKVHRFHRWSWRAPWRYNRRNHRKLLVVDKKEAYLGGFNIHRESSREFYGEQRWRDSHIRMRGHLARQASFLFDRFWVGDRRWILKVVNASSVLVPNHNIHCRRSFRCLYRSVFAGAEKTLYLTTPYFVPDNRTQKALKLAAERGVDVRLLVPGKSDVLLTQWAAQAAYASLLASGVRIFEYMPRMLHAKTVVIDKSWSSIGTANLDYRSFFLNYELNLVSRDRDLCFKLESQFFSDLNESREIISAHWARRRWYRRLLELIGWMARRWL